MKDVAISPYPKLLGLVGLFIALALFLGASAAMADSAGYVFTSASRPCEYVTNGIHYDAPSRTAYIFSNGFVNGPNWCSNYNYVGVPGTLTIRQEVWDVVGGVDCNYGVRLANPYSSHKISTSWGVKVYDICGYGFQSQYEVHTLFYYQDWDGVWVGGSLWSAPITMTG